MKINTSTGVIKGKTDAIAVCLFDDEVKTLKIPSLDSKTLQELTKLIAASKFAGKKDEQVLQYSQQAAAPLLILHGLGSRKEFKWQQLRLAAGAVLRVARDKNAKTLALFSADKLVEELSAEDVTKALVHGLVLGNWRFDQYRKTPMKEIKELTQVTIYYSSAARQRAAESKLEAALVSAESQNLAREYGTHPANIVNTEYLAAEAKKLSRRGIKVTVLDKNQMKRLGMNLLLAVSKGSAMPPKLIVMDYHPRNAKKTYAFVGKGLVFDSGGLNIKVASMEEMKSDMCGGAAVLAAMNGIAQLKPKYRVIGVIAAVENAVGPDSYRPSDIYTAMNGKTVEIMNTDAEGRLVLADALAYTVKTFKPDGIVDLATLTGAAVVSLGQMCDAVFTNNDNWRREVMDAAERAGERVWHLPIFEEHSKDMEGETAELRNFPMHRWGGACTAAAFLKEFVDDTPWVHIDIAPTAFPGKVSSIQPKATAAGSGVRTLLELVTR
jgi:leucyl aminopeptidase